MALQKRPRKRCWVLNALYRFLSLSIFLAEAGFVLNLVLDFEQKLASYVYKTIDYSYKTSVIIVQRNNVTKVWTLVRTYSIKYAIRVLVKPFILSAKLLLFWLPAFPWRLWGQQLEIKPVHFMVFHNLHYFAWVKPQVILSKILKAIGSFSSRSSNLSFLICFGK